MSWWREATPARDCRRATSSSCRGRGDRDDGARLPGARGAAGAVQVGLGVRRCVEVHDQADVVDVDAACGDVGGDDRLGPTGGELVQVALAHPLGEVAVQVDRLDTALAQRVAQLGGALAGAGEDDRAGVGLDERRDRVDLVAEAADDHHVVVHRGDRPGAGVELVQLRVAQVSADQPVHVAVEGGGEQHPLTAGGRLLQQGVDGRVEAEVAQVVGLVEHGDLDVVGAAVPLVDQVLEPARRGHDDVGSRAQLLDLAVVRRAAVHGGELEAGGEGQRLERAPHLRGQLAGRAR